MAKRYRAHSRRARTRRARQGADRPRGARASEFLLFRRLPPRGLASDRVALCCFARAGTRPGFHPGEDLPGGDDPRGAYLSVDPSTRRWEYLDPQDPGSTNWIPVQEDFIHTLVHGYLIQLECGALWIGPMTGDMAGWWGLEVDLERFLSLFWAEQVEPAPLHEPSRLALYREELSLALPRTRKVETTVVITDPTGS
jgi:hypothetical protein